MSRRSVIAARVRGLFRRRRRERELDAEIRFHLQMQMEENLRAGMDPTEASYAALRSFGAAESIKESYRDGGTFAWMDAIVQDVRYAIRTLRAAPGFTLTSVALLALAIGVNTAMFSVLNAVLFSPLPYQAPEQLTMLWTERSDTGVHEGRTAYWNVEQWREASRSFQSMAVFDPASATLADRGGAERIEVARISPNFFTLLGIRPQAGRSFSFEEAEGRQRLALISHRFWQARFGGSSQAIGATLTLDGTPCKVIGVLPAGFRFPYLDADVWQPVSAAADWDGLSAARGAGPWFVVGRLRPSVTLQQAQAEMDLIARRLDSRMPLSERALAIHLEPLRAQPAGSNTRSALWMLMCAVCLVLLIAATNVASLSLTRSATRENEFAIRAAIGASYPRIVRQVLTESLTLAAASGLLAWLIAWGGIRLLLVLKPGRVMLAGAPRLDLHVFLWASALCLSTGVLVGLAPAISLLRRNTSLAGRSGGRSVAGGVTMRALRGAFVVAEFGLSLTLLFGAGLLIRSLWAAENVHLGFSAARVLSIQLSTPPSMRVEQRSGFYDRLLQEVESLPDVESAGAIENFFLASSPEQVLTAEGSAGRVSGYLQLRSDAVSAGFFQALHATLREGRIFSAQDGATTQPVAIINEVMARRLWPGASAVGRRLKAGGNDSGTPWITVVGVVSDMRRLGLENDLIPQMFRPLAQDPPRLATLLVRTATRDPLRVENAVRSAVRRIDKQSPLYNVTTLDDQVDRYFTGRRFASLLLVGFAAFALVMSAIGIYGLLRYGVATRAREIAIRMALGSQASEIFLLIVREGLRLSVTGLLFGLAGALLLGRAGSALLFGVSSADPLTLFVVSLLLFAVALAACYFPARRAMRIEPLGALRQE